MTSEQKAKLREYLKECARNYMKKLKEEELTETTSTATTGDAGYLTPRAFAKDAGTATALQKRNMQVFGYEIIPKMQDNSNPGINEGVYFKDKELSESQKIGLAMREVRDNLYQVEKVMKRAIQMKNESDGQIIPGKRMLSALKKINEKVVRLMTLTHQIL